MPGQKFVEIAAGLGVLVGSKKFPTLRAEKNRATTRIGSELSFRKCYVRLKSSG